MEEVAPGIHRIESDLGPRFMAQYLLVGEERSMLVDTGLSSTPDEALAPALSAVGVEPDLVLISHADLDHCGGNRRISELYPSALLTCHELDRRWIESNTAMLAENYRWHEVYGLEALDEAEQQERLELLGGDAPVDFGLRGGETIRLGPALRFDVLHLPGHTYGHVGLWEPTSRVAIVIDAALLDGIYDRAGNKLIPPRYYDATGYRETIRRIRALEPELLLTAHYPVMGRVEASNFCDRSLAYVDAVESVVRAGLAAGETRLKELTDRVDAQLGPFAEFRTEIAAGVRSHLAAVQP